MKATVKVLAVLNLLYQGFSFAAFLASEGLPADIQALGGPGVIGYVLGALTLPLLLSALPVLVLVHLRRAKPLKEEQATPQLVTTHP